MKCLCFVIRKFSLILRLENNKPTQLSAIAGIKNINNRFIKFEARSWRSYHASQ